MISIRGLQVKKLQKPPLSFCFSQQKYRKQKKRQGALFERNSNVITNSSVPQWNKRTKTVPEKRLQDGLRV